MWVSDVFAWRASPAAWTEDLVHVVEVHGRSATPAETAKLKRLGEDPTIMELSGADGQTLTVAAASRDRVPLLGPLDLDQTTGG